ELVQVVDLDSLGAVEARYGCRLVMRGNGKWAGRGKCLVTPSAATDIDVAHENACIINALRVSDGAISANRTKRNVDRARSFLVPEPLAAALGIKSIHRVSDNISGVIDSASLTLISCERTKVDQV